MSVKASATLVGGQATRNKCLTTSNKKLLETRRVCFALHSSEVSVAQEGVKSTSTMSCKTSKRTEDFHDDFRFSLTK